MEQILDVRTELTTLDVLDGELPGVPQAAALVAPQSDHLNIDGVCLSYHTVSFMV